MSGCAVCIGKWTNYQCKCATSDNLLFLYYSCLFLLFYPTSTTLLPRCNRKGFQNTDFPLSFVKKKGAFMLCYVDIKNCLIFLIEETYFKQLEQCGQ